MADQIVVCKKLRGRGAGDAMLAKFRERCREMNVEVISILVKDGVREHWMKRGFSEIGKCSILEEWLIDA